MIVVTQASSDRSSEFTAVLIFKPPGMKIVEFANSKVPDGEPYHLNFYCLFYSLNSQDVAWMKHFFNPITLKKAKNWMQFWPF